MKHEFAVVGVFLGLGALVIGINTLPHGNLSADISANAPTSQLADLTASANPDGNAAAPADLQQSSTTPTGEGTVSSAPIADPSPADTPHPPASAAPTLTAAPVTPPLPALPDATPPQATLAQGTPATSTVATATITVTPTAPESLPAPSPQQAQASKPHPVAPGDLALPYGESNFSGDANWQRVWGVENATFAGYFDLSAGSGGTGGAVFLKKSSSWTNYTMNATLDWLGGKAIGLMANYNDASNYVACEYAKTAPGVITMRLAQYVAGSELFLTPGAPISWSGNGSNLALSMKVDGVHGACSFNGQTVSNDVVGPGISAMSVAGAGGVGFNISDPASNTSEIIVKQIKVNGN